MVANAALPRRAEGGERLLPDVSAESAEREEASLPRSTHLEECRYLPIAEPLGGWE